MPVSQIDAESTLRDISNTARASATFYGYRMASPHFVLWGVIWMIGYSASYLYPTQAMIWPVLDMVGLIGSFWLGWHAGRTTQIGGGWRYPATAFAVFLFIMAIFAVMPPLNHAQISAFFPILVALFYGLVGIWTGGVRMIVAGVVVAVLTLGGYFYLPQAFLLWMAWVGGGALILGGIWLRRA
jgi:hypothetical protein